jgi:hypothetical protein
MNARSRYHRLQNLFGRQSMIVVLSVVFVGPLAGQQVFVGDKWSYGTAYLEPKGKWETGLFQPFRYGLSNKTELFIQAITLPVIPNAGVKIRQGEWKGFILASEHEISCPTPFLQLVARKGMGGLISPQFSFPFILTISNSIVASKPLNNSLLFIARAGFTFAFRGKNPDPQSTIDLPLFYPRMAAWYKGSTIRAGASLKGRLYKKWYYEEALQGFLVTRSYDNYFVENSGTLMWASNRSFRIRGGYVLSYGRYPFGTHWQMWPSLDILFGKK